MCDPVVYILPGSGGYLVGQVAGLIAFMRASAKAPLICMSTSGGNIAGYAAHAGQWTESGTRRVINALRPEIFAVPWNRAPWLRWIPSWLIGVFNTSFYTANPHGAPEALFETVLDPSTLSSVEMWTGTVNEKCKKAQLFCNRSAENAILKSNAGTDLADAQLGSLPPIYLDGDIETLGAVALASASIPTLVPSVNIKGQKYFDGGDAYASPFPLLKSRLRHWVGTRPIHFVRFAGYNAENYKYAKKDTNILGVGLNSIATLQCSLCLLDRQTAIDMVAIDGCPIDYEDGVLDPATVNDFITRRRDTCTRSLVEVYPAVDLSVDIVSFAPGDISKAVDSLLAPGMLRYRCWSSTKVNINV